MLLMKPLLIAACLGAFLTTTCLAADTMPPDVKIQPFPKALVQNLWVQTIWSDGQHNGFPGIARVGDYYYVTFRSSESHQAPAAKIVVLRSAV